MPTVSVPVVEARGAVRVVAVVPGTFVSWEASREDWHANPLRPTEAIMPGTGVEEFANVLSILSPEEVRQLGELPDEAIVGIFVDQSSDLAAFRPNPRFLRFLHRVMAVAGPNDPALLAAAASQGTGWVYLIDGRTPNGPDGDVPAEDIIGGFAVANGALVEGGYQAIEVYRAFTSNGIIQLPSSLRESLLQALHEVVKRRRSLESPQ